MAEFADEENLHLDSLVNNAGVYKNRPAAGPQEGPEAFGAAMLAEDVEDWQQSKSIGLFLMTICYLPPIFTSKPAPFPFP